MANIRENFKTPLHPVQMQILNKLVFVPKAKFSDLKIKSLTTDHFTYHINKLLDLGLIAKENGTYVLTEAGKKFVSIMDTERAKHEQFGKRSVLLRAVRERSGKLEYLVYKRLKQPFYGYYGFHTGKVRLGETVVEAAIREFKEETGLDMTHYELVGVYHQIGYKPDGTLLRDVYLYEFNIFSYTGKLIELNKEEGVENKWLTKERLKGLPVYPDFWNKKFKINWQNLPQRYARYKKLEQMGQWINIPATLKGEQIATEARIYFAETKKIIKER